MTWFILILAGLFEVVWAVGLKYTEGFTRLMPTAITVVGMALSFWLLALALKALPLGTAYGVWVGIGALGVFIAGVILFNEPVNALRVVSILLVVAGLVGLKMAV